MNPIDTALLLIDVQKAFDNPAWGPRNNPEAESNIARLLAGFRASGCPVIHVRHDSLEPNSTLRADAPGNALKPEAQPKAGEPLYAKHTNSAFIGTELEAYLRAENIQGLVIAGFITNHCVSTTARMAGNLGFRTIVVSDACATFDFKDGDGVIPTATMHRVGLAELRGEFAAIQTTEETLATLD